MKRFYFLMAFINLGMYAAFAQQNKDTISDIAKIKNTKVNQAFLNRYKENSELSYLSPLGEIGAPSKYVVNGRLTNLFMVLGTKDLPIAFAIIPDFIVRVRNELSTGVRTPSFKVGGVLYARLNSQENHYKYAEVSYTHHSNGQDKSALNVDGTINTSTGNFSVNYLTLAYRFGFFTKSVGGDNYYFSNNHKLGLLWHKWFNYERAISKDFGFTRLFYSLSWRKYNTYVVKNDNGLWYKKSRNGETALLDKETWRFNADVSYAINKMQQYNLSSLKKRLNIEATFNYSLPYMNNVFLMLGAGYYGEDPYNIYYRDNYPYWRFGISTGFVRYRINWR